MIYAHSAFMLSLSDGYAFRTPSVKVLCRRGVGSCEVVATIRLHKHNAPKISDL